MTERTRDAIFLRTLDTGGYEVMNLSTGRLSTAWKVYEIPIPDNIVKKIEQMGTREGIKP